jgi:hypothetical protein
MKELLSARKAVPVSSFTLDVLFFPIGLDLLHESDWQLKYQITKWIYDEIVCEKQRKNWSLSEFHGRKLQTHECPSISTNSRKV